VFIGGSAGSAVAGWLYASHGWTAVTVFAAVLPLLAGGIWVYDALRGGRPARA
jgi:predicted MFS family arabinose efflux permease